MKVFTKFHCFLRIGMGFLTGLLVDEICIDKFEGVFDSFTVPTRFV